MKKNFNISLITYTQHSCESNYYVILPLTSNDLTKRDHRDNKSFNDIRI